MQDDLRRRCEQLRRQVEEQAVLTQQVRRDSKALRAAASAIVDETCALRLVVRGLAHDRTPPIPTHPPD